MNYRCFAKLFLKTSFLIFVWIPSFEAVAQESANPIAHVSIASPTSASLGKYADVPVGYHMGIPNVGIPVYNVESGSLKLPIALNYHAGGVKVQELASWVGMGWSLNAGGVITRTVRGCADDKGYQGYQGFGNKCTNGHYSDYGYNSYMMVGSVSTVLPDGKGTDDHIFYTGYKDGEPDLFFFNFGNYSGKFYFNDDRTPVLVPEQDVRIQTDYSLGPGFNGFILTTPDGNQYYFGRTGNYSSAQDPVELTIPSTIANGPANGDAAASSWYLNKIISAEGTDSITFQYQPEVYSYYTWSMFPITNYTTLQTTPSQLNGTDLVKNYVNGVRLSQINFANGKVLFTPSSSPRSDLSAGYLVSPGMNDLANTSSFSLGSISIVDNNGFCKKDSLYYGYFTDQVNADFHSTFWNSSLDVYNIHSDASCLRLDSIKEFSCDLSAQVPPYKFTYFSELLPRRLSFGIDHWGFYNGVNTNSTLIPSYTLKYQGTYTQKGGANRDAAWPAMRGGALQSIVYPMGGSDQFEFESHTTYCNFIQYTLYSSSGPSVGYGGGTQTTTPFYTTTNANTKYDFGLSSNLQSGSGNFEILDANNNVIQNYAAVNGSTVDYYCSLNPNAVYYLQLNKSSADGGSYGLSLHINEWTPTTVGGNTIVGGLRIKTVTRKDAVSSQNIVTSYSYNIANLPAGNSSGILYSKPTYVKLVKNANYNITFPYPAPANCNLELCSVTNGSGLCANSSDQYFKSPTSIRPMETTQGNHIGYNEVYVTRMQDGYSVYRYYGSNIWDYNINDVCTRSLDWDNTCDPTIPNTPETPLPFEFMRGELKYEGHFDQTGKLLKDVWHFPTYTPTPLITPGYVVTNCNNTEMYAEYQMQSARRTIDSTVETVYVPAANTYISSIKASYYNSPFHHQVTRQLSYTSAGDSLIDNIKYTNDFRIAACDALDNGISTYLTNSQSDSTTYQNTLNSCTPQGSTVSPLQNCRYIGIQQFRDNISNHRIQFVQTRKNNFTNAANQFDANHLMAEGSSDAILKPVLRLQDEYKIVPIEVSSRKNLNLRHASYTQYNISVSTAGYAYPGTTQLINLQSPSPAFSASAVSGNTITRDNRYLDEAYYIFSGSNPQQIIAHDGVPGSYIWDYKNTQPIAKIVNATVDQVAYTSFEADGSGSWTIGSSIRDAVAMTGTQSYNLANGACSRSGLTSTNTYIVSYWTTNASSYTITGTQGTAVQGKTILLNGTSWTYFEHKITGQTSISISGTGRIDELRLYPTTAQMVTYTYQPVLGMSSACDTDNRVTYYAYDALGRLRYIKDQDGNILKTIAYHYTGQ